jgi:hypothetical protein
LKSALYNRYIELLNNHHTIKCPVGWLINNINTMSRVLSFLYVTSSFTIHSTRAPFADYRPFTSKRFPIVGRFRLHYSNTTHARLTSRIRHTRDSNKSKQWQLMHTTISSAVGAIPTKSEITSLTITAIGHAAIAGTFKRWATPRFTRSATARREILKAGLGI